MCCLPIQAYAEDHNDIKLMAEVVTLIRRNKLPLQPGTADIVFRYVILFCSSHDIYNQVSLIELNCLPKNNLPLIYLTCNFCICFNRNKHVFLFCNLKLWIMSYLSCIVRYKIINMWLYWSFAGCVIMLMIGNCFPNTSKNSPRLE